MHRTFAFSSALCLSVFAATGCATTASNDLKTSGIYATYTLEQSEDSDYTARAQYRASASNGNLVELSAGEAVYVNDILLATKTKLAGVDINYSASIPKGSPAYSFEFRRSDGEMAKHDVAPPEAFAITSQALDGDYDASYTITWGAGTKGAQVNISASSTQTGCNVLTIENGLTDSGTYTFTGQKLKPTGMNAMPADCTYQLTVEKRVTATIGAPFKTGSGISVSKRVTTLHVAPVAP